MGRNLESFVLHGVIMPAPWEILGVARHASRKEVKEAYRLVFHASRFETLNCRRSLGFPFPFSINIKVHGMFRRLAKKWHPDLHGNSPAEVRAIAEKEFKIAQSVWLSTSRCFLTIYLCSVLLCNRFPLQSSYFFSNWSSSPILFRLVLYLRCPNSVCCRRIMK